MEETESRGNSLEEVVEALRRSEGQLRAILENIPHMIFVKAASDLRFVRFNRAGEALLGYSRDDLVGKSDHDFFPEAEANFFLSKDRAVLASGKAVDIPVESIATRNLGQRWLHTKKIPLLDAHGRPEFLLGISEDITERLAADESLRRSERRLRATIEALPDLVMVLDPTGRVLEYHAHSLEQYFDRPPTGQHVADLLEPVGAEALRGALRATIENQRGEVCAYARLLGGRRRHYEARFSIAQGEEIIVVVREVTDQQDAQEQRQRLVERVLNAQEEERRRVARELHDEAGQCLTSISVGLRAMENAVADETARAQLADLREVTGQVIREVSRLARGLMPHLLEDLGLEAAVRKMLDDLSSRHGVVCHLHVAGNTEPPLRDGALTISAYRIIQEALTNVAKHARASRVDVLLHREMDALRVVVADDGCGFEWTANRAETDRLGLFGLAERVSLLGGSLDLDTAPGAGTTLSVRLPILASSSAHVT